jgi:hypothetical protein
MPVTFFCAFSSINLNSLSNMSILSSSSIIFSIVLLIFSSKTACCIVFFCLFEIVPNIVLIIKEIIPFLSIIFNPSTYVSTKLFIVSPDDVGLMFT